MNIGLGLPTPVAHSRRVRSGARFVHFGRSKATLNDARARRKDPRVLSIKTEQGTAFTLWRAGDALVLTAEILASTSRPDGVLNQGGDGYHVGHDIAVALTHALLTAGHRETASLENVFGPTITAVMDPDRARVPISTLLRRSVEHVRGEPMTNGLYIIVRSDCSAEVEQLLHAPADDFTDRERAQRLGSAPGWRPLELAGTPAETGALSAIRDDGRVAILNQESMSVWHDYGGIAAGIVVAAIPVVAHRARTDSDYLALVQVLTSGTDEPLDAQLDTLARLRRARVQRQMLQRRLSPERFVAWTQSSTLATALLAQFEDVSEQDAELDAAARFLQEQAERERIERDRWLQSLLKVFSPVAGIAVVATIFAALTTIPQADGEGTMLAPGLALLATAGLSVLGALLGVVIQRVTDRMRPRARRAGGGLTRALPASRRRRWRFGRAPRS